MTPDELHSRLLYRDGLILVIDKPAGLPVHAGPGGGDNLEQFLDALRFGLPKTPALAHRLDRDTSGCLVLGRHAKALRKLGRMFSEGRVSKVYWAVVHGRPPADSGVIDMPLRKISRGRTWKVVAAPDGQKAVTKYRVLGRTPEMSWLELRPMTGRTHQIRVHLAEIGCPIVGDPVYGPNPKGLGGKTAEMHLHARAVTLPLYPKREPITVEASPPPHMRTRLSACGWTE